MGEPMIRVRLLLLMPVAVLGALLLGGGRLEAGTHLSPSVRGAEQQHSLRVMIAQKCVTVGGTRVCFEDGRNGRPRERKCPPGYVVLDKPNKYGAFCEKRAEQPQERACPPGYVVLEKPNKYGAYCEPVGQTQPLPPPQPQPESCPDGQVFYPNQGCLRETNCVTNTPESPGIRPRTSRRAISINVRKPEPENAAGRKARPTRIGRSSIAAAT